jgi:hypothetical protein
MVQITGTPEQLAVCTRCGKQKRTEHLGSITSWLRMESTCLCDQQQADPAQQSAAAPQSAAQKAPQSQFSQPQPAPLPGQPQMQQQSSAPAQAQSPVESGAAAGTNTGASQTPPLNYQSSRLGQQGLSNSAKAGMALCAVAAVVLVGGAIVMFSRSSTGPAPVPPRMVQPMIPVNHTNSQTTKNPGNSVVPTNTQTSTANSESTQAGGDQNPIRDPAPSQNPPSTENIAHPINPTSTEMRIIKDATPQHNADMKNITNEHSPAHDTAGSDHGPGDRTPSKPPSHKKQEKKVKKHPAPHPGQSQHVGPIDDFDRWNQFNSGH